MKHFVLTFQGQDGNQAISPKFFRCLIFEDQKRSLKKRNKPGNGGVAQLGEHLPCKQGVMGSNPIISTSAKMAHPRSGKYSDELKLQTPTGMNGKNRNQMSEAEKNGL